MTYFRTSQTIFVDWQPAHNVRYDLRYDWVQGNYLILGTSVYIARGGRPDHTQISNRAHRPLHFYTQLCYFKLMKRARLACQRLTDTRCDKRLSRKPIDISRGSNQ